MKKFFSFVAAVLFAGSMMAAPVVINYPAQGYANGTSLDGVAVTEGIVTVTLAKGSGTTAPAYYDTGTGARTYGGNTMTIAASEGKITGIEFNFTQNNKDYTVDSGTYSKETAIWTGEAAQVVFNTESGAGHNRIKTITVYLNGETPEVKENIKVNVAQAITAGMALDSMAVSDDIYEVTGYVVNAEPYNYQYKNQIWFMADDAANSGEQVFEAYSCYMYDGNELVQALDGDKVTLVGHLTKYYNRNEAKFVVEISGGKASFVEKIDADHTILAETIDTVTVAEAIDIAKALTPEKGKSASTSKTYAVKGFIVGTSTKTEKTWYMADEADAYGEFQAYKCASVDKDVAEGDFVIVTGKIQHYYGEGSNGEYHTYEISNGALVHAEAPQGIENITLTEKAQKVVVDGVVYIVRDNKLFNLQGAQVR